MDAITRVANYGAYRPKPRPVHRSKSVSTLPSKSYSWMRLIALILLVAGANTAAAVSSFVQGQKDAGQQRPSASAGDGAAYDSGKTFGFPFCDFVPDYTTTGLQSDLKQLGLLAQNPGLTIDKTIGGASYDATSYPISHVGLATSTLSQLIPKYRNSSGIPRQLSVSLGIPADLAAKSFMVPGTQQFDQFDALWLDGNVLTGPYVPTLVPTSFGHISPVIQMLQSQNNMTCYSLSTAGLDDTTLPMLFGAFPKSLERLRTTVNPITDVGIQAASDQFLARGTDAPRLLEWQLSSTYIGSKSIEVLSRPPFDSLMYLYLNYINPHVVNASDDGTGVALTISQMLLSGGYPSLIGLSLQGNGYNQSVADGVVDAVAKTGRPFAYLNVDNLSLAGLNTSFDLVRNPAAFADTYRVNGDFGNSTDVGMLSLNDSAHARGGVPISTVSILPSVPFNSSLAFTAFLDAIHALSPTSLGLGGSMRTKTQVAQFRARFFGKPLQNLGINGCGCASGDELGSLFNSWPRSFSAENPLGLTLGSNNYNTTDVVDIVTGLRDHTVSFLTITGNKIDDLSAIASAIAANNVTIGSIDLSANTALGSASPSATAQAITKLLDVPGIQRINLASCNLSPEFFYNLALQLLFRCAPQQQLVILDFRNVPGKSENLITNDVLDAFSFVLGKSNVQLYISDDIAIPNTTLSPDTIARFDASQLWEGWTYSLLLQKPAIQRFMTANREKFESMRDLELVANGRVIFRGTGTADISDITAWDTQGPAHQTSRILRLADRLWAKNPDAPLEIRYAS